MKSKRLFKLMYYAAPRVSFTFKEKSCSKVGNTVLSIKTGGIRQLVIISLTPSHTSLKEVKHNKEDKNVNWEHSKQTYIFFTLSSA